MIRIPFNRGSLGTLGERRWGSGVLIVVGVAGLAAFSRAGESYVSRPIHAVKATVAPKIDGDLSDPCWATAAKAEDFSDQITGALAQDHTVAYITYDKKNIYVAFDCKDSHPEQITARETIRDQKFQQSSSESPTNTEDNVEVDFDTFQTHKRQDLSLFSVNAIGTPSASLAGGRANKAEWKGDFVTAAKRTADGWTAEMQIPWASLNYPQSNAPLVFGINFMRYQNRTTTPFIWSNIGPQSFLDKEGLWQGVDVPKGEVKPKLSLLPYALGMAEPDGRSLRFGLDARYPVTPELTAVGTFKPDFSTVEGAVQSITFSRTEKFLPDFRPFFLEGANFFNVGTQFNDIGAFFYPNRIHSFDAGTKLYGKIDPKDTIGFLDAYDFNGRNDVAFRLNHNIDATSSIGTFYGAREEVGDRNSITALDYHGRWGKLSYETIEGTTQGRDAGGGAFVQSINYQDKMWLGLLQYHDVSNNFKVEDGFVPFTGYKGFFGFVDYHSQYRHGWIRRLESAVIPIYWWDTHGKAFLRGGDIQTNITTKSDWFFLFDYNQQKFGATTDNTLSGQIIDGYTNRFRQIGLQYQIGVLADHPATFLGPTASFRLFKKFDVSYGGALLNLQGHTQQHIITANYQFSPTRSLGGRLVTQDADTNWYLFYHNSGGKGTEYYVVLGDPNAQKFVKRLEFKVVFAF